MGLFSKKPKSSAPETSAAPANLLVPGAPPQRASPPASPGKPTRGKKYSVDPTDFLALRSEMMELKARLEASEQAKALVETRLDALDATTTAMVTERPPGDDLNTRVTELQAQLDVVAETAAAAHANAESAAAAATAAADIANEAASSPADTSSTPFAAPESPDTALVARIDALAAKVEAGPAPDAGLLARLDQLSARIDSASDAARVVDLEARVGELAARVDQPAEAVVAAVPVGADDDTLARLDALTERVAAIDAFGSQLAQLNARVTAQAEFGAQLGSLRDRINELSNDTEDRRAAAVAATGDADLRDRVNAIADHIGGNEGIAAQIMQLAERVAANDTSTRQAAGQVAAIEQRLDSVSTELANQVSELGRDIDGLAAHNSQLAGGTVTDEMIDSLKTSQVRLAAEQARYEIAFRQDLAALAEQVRRKH